MRTNEKTSKDRGIELKVLKALAFGSRQKKVLH